MRKETYPARDDGSPDSAELRNLSFCLLCGQKKIYHLCPNCDQEVIHLRQTRIQSGLNSARKVRESRRADLDQLILQKDRWAQKKYHQGQGHPLIKSVILGFFVALPMTLIGLHMLIEGISLLLGLLAFMVGLIAVSFAIHYRIVHDYMIVARRWLSLTDSEKEQEIKFQRRYRSYTDHADGSTRIYSGTDRYRQAH